VGYIVKEEWDEEWERESDIGELSRGPVGEETDLPIRVLDVSVDRGNEMVAPRWSFGIGCNDGDAEYAVSVELVKE
jgi:hypothetical protein